MALKKNIKKKSFSPKEVNKKVVKKKVVKKAPVKKPVEKEEVVEEEMTSEEEIVEKETTVKKKVDLTNEPEVDMSQFEIPEEGTCTKTQFLHNFAERLNDAGIGVNKRVAGDIMEVYSTLLKDVISGCSYKDTVLGAAYKNKYVDLRAYGSNLEKVEHDTLVFPHNRVELRIEYVNVDPEDLKVKGKYDKEKGIFTTLEGEEYEV